MSIDKTSFAAFAEREASKNDLDEIRHRLAEALVLHGRIDEEKGVVPPNKRGVSRSFSYPLPTPLVKKIAPNEGIPIPEQCYVKYAPESMLETQDGVYSDEVFLSIAHKDPSTGLVKADTYRVGGQLLDDPTEGLANTEYSKDGMRVSPGMLETRNLTHEDLHNTENHQYLSDVIDDVQSLQRPLDGGDMEMLRIVAEFVESASVLTD